MKIFFKEIIYFAKTVRKFTNFCPNTVTIYINEYTCKKKYRSYRPHFHSRAAFLGLISINNYHLGYFPVIPPPKMIRDFLRFYSIYFNSVKKLW